MPPSRPIALNLATLVHRLTTNPRGWEVRALCEELEIADRTYRKYRQLLQEEFFPFIRRGRSLVQEVSEGEARYLRLEEGTPDASDTAALLQRLTAHHLARRVLSFMGHKRGGNALEEAFQSFWSRTRVGARFTQVGRLQRDLDRLFHFVPDAPKDYEQHEEILAVVLEALVQSRPLRMVYESAARGPQEHEVEPLTLALYRSGLHLFARYAGKKRVYNFVVDRIQEAELLERVFDYPSERQYSPERFTATSFGIFFQDRGGGGERVAVELLFATRRWLQLYLQERQWAPDQRFEELADGRLRMTFTARSMVEVWPWIRQFGPEVEVLSPEPEPQ